MSEQLDGGEKRLTVWQEADCSGHTEPHSAAYPNRHCLPEDCRTAAHMQHQQLHTHTLTAAYKPERSNEREKDRKRASVEERSPPFTVRQIAFAFSHSRFPFPVQFTYGRERGRFAFFFFDDYSGSCRTTAPVLSNCDTYKGKERRQRMEENAAAGVLFFEEDRERHCVCVCVCSYGQS